MERGRNTQHINSPVITNKTEITITKTRAKTRITIFIILLVFTLLLSPPLAATGLEQGEPVLTVPPAMNYQPPLGATQLSEFLPAGVILQTIPVTIPTPPSGPVPPGSPVPPPTPITVTTPILLPQDAYSFADNRVTVVVEENTFPTPTRLQFTPLPFSAAPFTTTLTYHQTPSGTFSSDTGGYTFLTFRLEAVAAATGQPHPTFPHPARLVIDIRDLTAGYNLSGYQFYLAYRDETDPSHWIDVPFRVHQADGLLSVELTHFSEWAAGVRPDKWQPHWNPPGVAEFSGAVTASYPIQVPPGRHGMQPSVSLSYSGAGLNGRIFDSDEWLIADGWSMAEISIVREEVKYENGALLHPDKFRLVLNGTGYELRPHGSTLGNNVSYYAMDGPGLRITRHFDSNAPNQEGLFWIVDTNDGTRYRLGYTAEAEKWQSVNNSYHLVIEGHRGRNADLPQSPNPLLTSALSWHVDTVTDTFGNQMQYHYRTRVMDEEIDLQSNTIYLSTHKNRLFEIRYNYNLRYTGSLPVPINVAQPGTVQGNSPATIIRFRNPSDTQSGYETAPITHIYLFHGHTTQPIREYRLTAASHFYASPGCLEIDSSHFRTTRVITQIQEWVGTDNDPTTNDGGYTLPATSFSYTTLPHFHRNQQECFRFSYLSGYHNGYGGTVTFQFEHDGDPNEVEGRGRAVGNYQRLGSLYYQSPEIGYSYHVKQMSVNDGRNPNVTTSYSYTAPCYNQTDANLAGNWGVMSGASRCYTLDSPSFNGVTGFRNVTITARDYQGSSINVRQLQFHLEPSAMTGKNEWSRLYLANGTTLMQESSTSYQTLYFGPLNLPFRPVQATITTQYSNGVGTPSLSSKTEYTYDTQGGVQYGNVTEIREYSDAGSSTPYRVTKKLYYPNPTPWIVGQASITALYEGDGTTLLNATYLTYDNQSSPSQPPTKGAVTRSAQAQPISCAQVPGGGGGQCAYARQTIEQTFVYNGYGSQTSSRQYTDYGYRVYNSSHSLITTTYPSQYQQTSISYENGYNLYPITVTNALNHSTSFQIYGFNGVGLDGFQKQRGLLRAVLNPNGTETRYEYDPFGRLHAVFDSADFTGFGDTDRFNGNPVNLYRYWDNQWNHGTSVWLNPAGNQPFAISEHTRHGTFNGQSGQFMYKMFTYFDGLDRPIQSQNRGAAVHGLSEWRDIVTLTSYNAQGVSHCTSAPFSKTHVPDSHVPAFYTALPCTSSSLDPTLTSYDNLARPLTITSPGGAVTSYSYAITNHITASGYSKLQRTQIFDPLNHLRSLFQNSLGQLVLVREISGNNGSEGAYTAYADTRYNYDTLGNLTEVGTSLPSDIPVSSWLRLSYINYDGYGRKIVMNDPDMGQWEYQYNALGSLTRQTDQKGQVLCFYYDSLNRIQRKIEDSTPATPCPTYATAPTSGVYHLASYRYDTDSSITYPRGLGQLVETTWGPYPNAHKDLFNYDPLGRVSSQTRTLANRSYTFTTLTWDILNRPLTLRTPHNNEIITLSYDHEGENSLVAGSDTLVSNITYNQRGQMVSLVRSSFTSSYSYYNGSGNSGTGNNNFRLSSIQHGYLYDNLPNFSYSYDKVGNILGQTIQLTGGISDSQNYSYDHLNRLKTASGSGNISGVAAYSHTYSYDRLGNLTSMGSGSYDYSNGHTNCATPTPPLPHAVRQVEKLMGYDYFCYDDNGNMTTRKIGSTTYSQSYDVENRLTEVTANTSSTVTRFSYDAAGQRTISDVETPGVSKTVTYYPFPTYQEEVRYEWGQECEGDKCSYAWLEQATVKKSTYFMAGQAIATRITGDPDNNNNGLFYLLTDHLGSTSMLITIAGAVVAGTSAYYQPYGNYRTTPPNTLTERGYTGHHENRDIGLTYMNARYYIPGLGRFLTADTLIPNPTNPQSHNRYTYVRGNPLVLVDPTGHYECHSDNNICVDATTPPPPSRTPPVSIWTRSFIDEPDWVQYYGHTKFAEGYGYSTNSGQHPGLDYGKSGQSFGGTWNSETKQWGFDGTYGTSERPLIPVYAGCYCNVSSTSTGSPYAPGRVNLTHESYSDFSLIYGHLQDIQVTSGSVTPDTIIGYLDTSERHLHLEIRRISDNHFINPFPYLSAELQTEMLSFRGVDRSTTYQPGYPAHPAYQRSGYYLR